ncbi:serine protease [Longimonas halophila]|uniref:Serine protease n=1 Tax=Longimonas halophila TaxID=1469170 RepID=A0A2H3P432_9BACT|nr:trypsin-like peptidase domain-containing protein [Longimonas halophila]PEN05102.1 serine protease [Longimonas halophila]
MSVKGKASVAVLLAAAFIAGILFTTAGANLFGWGDSVGTESRASGPGGTTAISTTDSEGFQRAVSLEDAFMEVAESVNPAVVQIRSETIQEQRSPFQGTPFEDFFGRPPGGQGGQGGNVRQGLGSGVVVRSDGHIITNNHVVEGADDLNVRLFDGEVYDAEVVGTDPYSDLAVIKIDAEDLRVVSFGDSEQIRPGQWVMAFGSPLDQRLSNSVTAGIISAKGRLQPSGQQDYGVQNFIQTDAAINPGNSGGPLVNLDGRLAGINTAIASRTGQFQGVGFAIPSNTVQRVTNQLIETGRVERARLGVEYRPASQSLIRSEGLPRGTAQIGGVMEGTAAEEANLQPGDLITAIDGEELDDALQISNIIGAKQPGDVVELTINREGETMTVEVELGGIDDPSMAESNNESESENDSALSSTAEDIREELGLALTDVSARELERLGINVDGAVLIEQVDVRNPAVRDSGLQPRQLIVQAAGEPTPSVEAFAEVYDQIEPGQSFRVRVMGPQGTLYVTALQKPAS